MGAMKEKFSNGTNLNRRSDPFPDHVTCGITIIFKSGETFL